MKLRICVYSEKDAGRTERHLQKTCVIEDFLIII